MSSFLSLDFAGDMCAVMGLYSQWNGKGRAADICEGGERFCSLPSLAEKVSAVVADLKNFSKTSWAKLGHDVTCASNGVFKVVSTLHTLEFLNLGAKKKYVDGSCALTDVYCSAVELKEVCVEVSSETGSNVHEKRILWLKVAEVACCVALSVIGALALVSFGAAVVAAIGAKGVLALSTAALVLKLTGDQYKRSCSRV